MATSQTAYTNKISMYIRGVQHTAHLTVRDATDYPLSVQIMQSLTARTLMTWCEVMTMLSADETTMFSDDSNLSAWMHMLRKLQADDLAIPEHHTAQDAYVTVWGYRSSGSGDSITLHDYTLPNDAIALGMLARNAQATFWQFSQRFGVSRYADDNQTTVTTVTPAQAQPTPQPQAGDNPYLADFRMAEPIGDTHLKLPLGKGTQVALIANAPYDYRAGHTYDHDTYVAYLATKAVVTMGDKRSIKIHTTKGHITIWGKEGADYDWQKFADMMTLLGVHPLTEGTLDLTSIWAVFKATVTDNGKRYLNFYGLWKVKA